MTGIAYTKPAQIRRWHHAAEFYAATGWPDLPPHPRRMALDLDPCEREYAAQMRNATRPKQTESQKAQPSPLRNAIMDLMADGRERTAVDVANRIGHCRHAVLKSMHFAARCGLLTRERYNDGGHLILIFQAKR